MSVLYVGSNHARPQSSRSKKPQVYALLHFYLGTQHTREKPEVLGGEIAAIVKAKDRHAAKTEAFEALRQESLYSASGKLGKVKPVYVLILLDDALGFRRENVAYELKQPNRFTGMAPATTLWEAVKDYEGQPLTVIDVY